MENSTIDRGQIIGGVKQPIVLRQSVVYFVLKLIILELAFDLVHALIRIPEIYFNFPTILKIDLIPYYFFIFITLSVFRIAIILTISFNWINKVYEIGESQIKVRWGIFNTYEKIYACDSMQEVTYSQNFFERLFNFGSIEIYSPALKEKIVLHKIPNPRKHQEIIRRQLIQSNKVSYLISQ